MKGAIRRRDPRRPWILAGRITAREKDAKFFRVIAFAPVLGNARAGTRQSRSCCGPCAFGAPVAQTELRQSGLGEDFFHMYLCAFSSISGNVVRVWQIKRAKAVARRDAL